LIADVTGEIEKDDRVLLVKRIHVRYRLKLQPDQREAAERVHAIHADYCPVARTIKGCVAITTELHLENG